MRRLALAAALGAAALLLAAPGAGARDLSLGFFDPAFSSPTLGAQRLDDAALTARATVVRLGGSWGTIARRRPAAPADPGDPAYDWAGLDTSVRNASDRGLTVLIGFSRAPGWAEGPGREPGAPYGTWRPDAAAYRLFAEAAARRYSGAYTPPGAATPLPRVRYWQGWNEPNLDLYLTPQWVRRGKGYRAESPRIYRALQNAFYAGVRAVHRSNRVLGAGTAPYGDLRPGGNRIMPVRFLREALCLDGRNRPRRCGAPIRFDILDHHPYGIRGPASRALNRDDVSVPDIVKLTRVMRAAQRARRLAPRGRKRVWTTEISWDTSPPDPDGVPTRRQARWMAQSFEILWRQGVDTVLWYAVRDDPPKPSYPETYQSGILLQGGEEKPSARAFRFPVVVRRQGRRVRVWALAPARGVLRVEVRTGARTRVVRRVRVRAGDVVVRRLRYRPGRWSAAVGELSSPAWAVR